MDFDAVRQTAFAAGRLTTFAAGALLFGLVPVLYVVMRPAVAALPEKQWAKGRANMALRIDLLVRIALWALAAAVVVVVAMQATVVGELQGAGFGFGSLTSVFESRFGQWLLVRGVMAVALAILLVGRIDERIFAMDSGPAQRRWWSLWGILGLVLLLTISMSGHAAAADNAALAVSVDVLHLAASASWFAGIVVLAAVLPVAWGRKRDTVQARLLTPVVARFSNLALVMVLSAALTGAINSVFGLDSLSQLTTTDYGQALFTKVWIFVWILVLGGVNHFFLRRRLEAAVAARRPSGAGETLRVTVATELLFAFVIFGATAILTGLAPPA